MARKTTADHKEQAAKSGIEKPEKRRTQAERTALSDRLMCEAAIALIGTGGTHNMTLKQVGEDAGYSRGLASGRFGSKEALFAELIRTFNRRWKNASELAIGELQGLEAFAAAIDGVTRFLMENRDYVKAMFVLYYETIGSSTMIRELLSAQHSAYRRDVETWIRQAIEQGKAAKHVSPESFSIRYLSVLFGGIFQWLVSPEKIDLTHMLYSYRDDALKRITES